MKTLSLLFFIFLLFSCTRSGKDLVSEVERQSPLVTNDISNQQITAFGEDGKYLSIYVPSRLHRMP